MGREWKVFLILIIFIILFVLLFFVLYKPPELVTTPIESLTISLPYPITREILSLYDIENSAEKYVGTGLYDVDIETDKGFIRIYDTQKTNLQNTTEIKKQSYLSDYPFEITVNCVPNLTISVWWLRRENGQKLIDAINTYDCKFSGEVDKITISIPENFSFIFSKEINNFFDKQNHPLSGIVIHKDLFKVEYGKVTYGQLGEFFIQLEERKWDDYYRYFNVNTTYEAYKSNAESDMDWDATHYNYYNFKNTTFKNGYFWSFDANYKGLTRKHSKAMWFCSDRNISIFVSSIIAPPNEPISFDEIKDISRYLC